MQDDLSSLPPEKPKRWATGKVVASLLVVGLFFGGGVVVGKYGLKTAVTSSNSSSINYSSVNHLYDLLKKDFDGSLDQNKLLDGIKSGLVTATGDPYTVYFNSKDAQAFNDEISGSFTGIGAELGSENGHIVIVAPLSGYPAAKAGLKPKDVIAGIDGQTTSGMTIDQAVSKIRGPENTKVKLLIIRGAGQPFEVSVTRAKITIPSVKSKIEGSIGYLKITQFSDDTIKLAQAAAQKFKDKSVKAVILDLRSNPGGFLDGAVGVSSLWLDSGQTVVQERRGSQVVGTEYASGGNLLKGLPTVVLIDSGSASASEITAGALRDNNVATLLGIKSFGKGSVQQVEKLSDGSEVKITIARWYTPGGKNIDKQGITPDVIVKISDAQIKAGQDPQKDKATAILQTKIQ